MSVTGIEQRAHADVREDDRCPALRKASRAAGSEAGVYSRYSRLNAGIGAILCGSVPYAAMHAFTASLLQMIRRGITNRTRKAGARSQFLSCGEVTLNDAGVKGQITPASAARFRSSAVNASRSPVGESPLACAWTVKPRREYRQTFRTKSRPLITVSYSGLGIRRLVPMLSTTHSWPCDFEPLLEELHADAPARPRRRIRRHFEDSGR